MAQRIDRPLSSRESRTALRRFVRRAVRGDTEAFASLAAPYLDLITEYLVLCGIEEDRERRTKTIEVLREMWKFLPFIHRVADFERLLATTLFSVGVRETSAAAFHRRVLLDLTPREKLAFLARDFENWDYPVIAAALRTTRKILGEIVISVRCRLLGLDLQNLDGTEADCVRRLSLDLDGQHGPREKKRLCHQLRGVPRAREFKSEWLDLRCQLIEFRQQIRLTDDEKAALLQETTAGLQSDQMIRVPLLDRLVGRLTPSRTAPVTAL